MKIGLDAKRIFSNATGLGVYGRNLVYGLNKVPSAHSFTLFTPKDSNQHINKSILNPQFEVKSAKTFSSYYWRTLAIKKDLRSNEIDIYHGLSNELPIGIEKLNIKTVVDIHDLCFIHFKSDYSFLDRQIFWYKSKRAARVSNKIIATSQATKKDIVRFFQVPAEKVEVVYQCCDQSFYSSSEILQQTKKKYQLPEKYVLSVGTIQGRKNQKAIVRAMAQLPKKEQIAIVLVGQGKSYLEELLKISAELKVEVVHIHNVYFNDLPSIYQSASLFVYPSFVEGFGIPVLEAMASKIPVITSRDTSMAEIIKNEDCLINPADHKELAKKIAFFLKQSNTEVIERSYHRALEFSQELFAKKVLEIYQNL